MESERAWAWKDGWTHGHVGGFVPRSIFYKDESGNAAYHPEVAFFLDWDPLFWRSIMEPGVAEEDDLDSDRYDRRNVVGKWWWVRWAFGEYGHPNQGGLPEVGAKLRAFIRSLGLDKIGVGTKTGALPRPEYRETAWRSVVQEAVVDIAIEEEDDGVYLRECSEEEGFDGGPAS